MLYGPTISHYHTHGTSGIKSGKKINKITFINGDVSIYKKAKSHT